MARVTLSELFDLPKEEVVKAFWTLTGVELLKWEINQVEAHIKKLVEDEAYHHSVGIVKLHYLKKALEHFQRNLNEVYDE